MPLMPPGLEKDGWGASSWETRLQLWICGDASNAACTPGQIMADVSEPGLLIKAVTSWIVLAALLGTGAGAGIGVAGLQHHRIYI